MSLPQLKHAFPIPPAPAQLNHHPPPPQQQNKIMHDKDNNFKLLF